MSKKFDDGYGMRQRLGLFLGPAVFLIILLIPAPDGPTPEAWAVAGVATFMATLPFATPPNAIVYGSGMISIPQMARAGFIFNILMVFIITGTMYLLLGHVFNVLWGNS